jgi:DNA primase
MPKEKTEMTRIPAVHLRRIRNDIDLLQLIRFHVDLPFKIQEGYLRFLCPLCGEFNTAVNPKTNLGRCFGCKTNFNPIDLVMILNHYSFLQAVAFLERFL